MRSFLAQLTAFGLLFVALQAAPAQAQATRTWVSGVGDDANPCSRTAPCKTFAGAISKTAPAGEINVLDPGGFGAVTITKSISIIAQNVEGGVLVSGTNGIVINALPTDKVTLDGLDIDGAAGSGLNGISVVGSGHITIRNITIRNFSQNAINLAGAAGTRAFIDNVLMTGNAGGLNIAGAGGATNNAILQNSVLDNNGAFATQIAGPSTLILIGCTMSGSTSSIIASGGASVVSYGNNVIRNAGAPTSTVAFQ